MVTTTTMGNHRSGPSSTSTSMGNLQSGQPSTSRSGKAPEGKKRKPASNDNQENSGITTEQWATYKNIRSQLAGKKKAELAAKDDGMSSIFILAGCSLHL